MQDEYSEVQTVEQIDIEESGVGPVGVVNKDTAELEISKEVLDILPSTKVESETE